MPEITENSREKRKKSTGVLTSVEERKKKHLLSAVFLLLEHKYRHSSYRPDMKLLHQVVKY